MRKQTTFLAVLSTAVFTASMAFPAYAKAAGWTEENGNWYYYDSYGDPLTDTWKKSGNDWYYLNADGVRAYSEQIDEYYVNEEGKRVTYQWVTMDNEDYWSEDDAPEFLHYYYGKDGKALTSTWASIDGNWYYFNEDSIMETGSIQVDGYNYYLGEDGSRKTGWVLLEEETDDPEDLNAWYYFDSNGRRIENEIDKKIDGSYYTFEEGKMQTGWYKLPVTTENTAASDNTQAEDSAETATASQATAADQEDNSVSLPTISGYKYYDEDGKRASGWRTIEGVENISEDGEYFRFYFKNGAPYYGKEDLEIFTIDSKKYAFNTAGEMQTGKQSIKLSDGTAANYEYYGAAEPPVRCGESHLSGLTEPPHFFIKLLCHCWVQSIYFSHREVFSWVNTFNIDLIGIIRYAIHDGIGKSTFTITDLLVPLTFMELRTKDC